jgi:hypothetical protein
LVIRPLFILIVAVEAPERPHCPIVVGGYYLRRLGKVPVITEIDPTDSLQ